MAHEISHDPHAEEHAAMGVHKAHPTVRTYLTVAAILTAITVVEVAAYYVPSFVASRAFVPALLFMSAIKFVTVVMFYMHLRYDHKLFRALFTGPLVIAALTIIGLLFLFGYFSVRTGVLT